MNTMTYEAPLMVQEQLKHLAEGYGVSESQIITEIVCPYLLTRRLIEPFEFRLIMEEYGVKYE